MDSKTTAAIDGGPAFPLQSIGPDFAHGYAGMTLRDYFAAKAMQGELSCQREGYEWSNFAKLAVNSYAIADAMLAARSAS